MKINMPLLKLIMRLLILLIMFVMLFLISAFLYSARYWKDVYAYITPNITIKRIPTVSELNTTENEFTTEIYYTTTNLYDYDGISTTEALEISYEFENENDTVEEDLMSFHVVEKRGSDDFEVQSMDVYEHEGVLYDEFKRSTAEPQDMPAFGPYIGYVKQKSDADVMYDIAVYDPQSTKGTLTTDSCVTRSRSRDVTSLLFPWVAAIFVRDVSSSRYTYVCDGAVLSQYTVLTAAHCLRNDSVVTPLKDIIIVLGKLSQKDMDGNEIYKPRDVIIHNSYSQDGGVRHDLALLVTETRIEYREKRVEPACLAHGETEAIEAVSTGWNISGDLIPIPFRGGHNDDCLQEHEKQSKNVFCSTYLSDITTCPSYGGIYAERLRDGVWYLRGIQTADEINQRFCVNRNVRYTDLTKYADWLRLNVV